MAPAPRAERRRPRALRKSAAASPARGRAGRTASQAARPSRSPTPLERRNVGQVTILEFVTANAFTSTFTATAELRVRCVLGPDDRGPCQAQGQFTGAVAGRTGTVALRGADRPRPSDPDGRSTAMTRLSLRCLRYALSAVAAVAFGTNLN